MTEKKGRTGGRSGTRGLASLLKSPMGKWTPALLCALCFALCFLAGPATAEATGCILDVHYITQETNARCGPASTQIVLKYKGIEETQEALAEKDCSIVDCIRDTLRSYGFEAYECAQSGALSEKDFGDMIFASLLRDCPVIVNIRCDSLEDNSFGYVNAFTHYVVAYGAYEENGVKRIRIADPFSGSWYEEMSGQDVDVTLSELYRWHKKAARFWVGDGRWHSNGYIIYAPADDSTGKSWSERKE